MGWRERLAKRLDWIEEDNLAGMFSRAWEDEIHLPKPRQPTNTDLRKWMDAAERKMVAALRRIKAKEYKRYRDGQ